MIGLGAMIEVDEEMAIGPLRAARPILSCGAADFWR